MASANIVILLGRLGKDPELTYTQGGMAIAKFTLATSEKRNGEEKTEWHRVVMFKETAENAAKYLVKGSQVYIEGKISYGSYEKNGVTVYTTDIMARNFQMLDKRQDTTTAKPKPREEPADDYDDLPF